MREVGVLELEQRGVLEKYDAEAHHALNKADGGRVLVPFGDALVFASLKEKMQKTITHFCNMNSSASNLQAIHLASY